MVQWRGRRESDNVEDRRGEGGGGGFQFPGGSGGGLPFPMPGGRKGGGIGIVGLLIMLGIALLLGINPLDILTGGGQFPMPQASIRRARSCRSSRCRIGRAPSRPTPNRTPAEPQIKTERRSRELREDRAGR